MSISHLLLLDHENSPNGLDVKEMEKNRVVLLAWTERHFNVMTTSAITNWICYMTMDSKVLIGYLNGDGHIQNILEKIHREYPIAQVI